MGEQEHRRDGRWSPARLYGALPVRGKILLPFVALFAVAWFAVAMVLGTSMERRVVHETGNSLHDLATLTTRTLRSRALGLEQLASLVAANDTLALAVAARDTTTTTAHISNTWWAKPPYMVQVLDTRGRTLAISLPGSVVQEPPRDLRWVTTAAGTETSAAFVVHAQSGRFSYLVGTAPVTHGIDHTGTVVIVELIDDAMLATVGAPSGRRLTVVGPNGPVASTEASLDHAGLGLTADRIAALVERPADVEVAGLDLFTRDRHLVDAVQVRLGEAGSRLWVLATTPDAVLRDATAMGWRQAWVLFFVGTCGAVGVALLVSSAITRPLRTLTEATGRLRRGDLDARAPVSTRDEIGTLASSFNSLAAQLRERAEKLDLAFAELKHLSETDPLTGLLNRRTLEGALQDEIQRARRYGEAFSVIMVDIDDFKLLNDTYGHPAGDRVIREVAALIVSLTRGSDKVGRYGGDEFMLVLPETGGEAAAAAARKLRAAVSAEPFRTPDGHLIPIRLSFGIAGYPDCGRDANELVAYADSNLYTSKRKGGDTITAGDEDASADGDTPSAFGMLESMVTAVDNKDSYTSRHSEEVTRYALAIADVMALSDASRDALRVAGLLHDVGKIGVPDRILRKPGPLTPQEFEIVKQHAVLGEHIITSIPNIDDVRAAVGAHHEHWDGTGYPRRVAGERIPLLGRILAVADAFSAMTTDRPYRKGLTHETALAELRDKAGTQLDPRVVAAFLTAYAAPTTPRGETPSGR